MESRDPTLAEAQGPAPQFLGWSPERRLELLTLAVGGAGALALQFWHGWTWSVGLALGAALSWLNLRWLMAGVAGLAPPGATSARAAARGALARFLGRVAVLGVALYAIFFLRWFAFPAVLAGLFAAVVAALAEGIYQLLPHRAEGNRTGTPPF